MKRRYCTFLLAGLLFQPILVNASGTQKITTDKFIVTAQNEIQPLQTGATQDVPMGQDPSGATESLLPEDTISTDSDDDLFGTPGGGYVHPFLSISGEYTDNLFNVNEYERTNFLTTLSPGIWLATPRRKDIPIDITPNNTSSGGLQLDLPDYMSFDRLNAYLLGAANFKFYSEDSDLNDYDGRIEGLFKYNLRGGLSIQFVDRYSRDQDRFDIGNAPSDSRRSYQSDLAQEDIDWDLTENIFIGNDPNATSDIIGEDFLRQYRSNLAQITLDWDISEKFRAKLDYANFYLDYTDDDDTYMDRIDNTYSIYGYYKYSLKTSLFLEYQYVDVGYDTDKFKDNSQNYYYGGIHWITTDKTSFLLKAGYQDREYKNDIVNDVVNAVGDLDNDAFAVELTFEYQITEKAGIILSANHKLEETDYFLALDKKVLAGDLRYHHKLTERLLGIVDLAYENADYGQLVTTERNDDRFIFKPALQYIIRDWLMAEISYEYDTRSSTDDYFDYSTNTISFSLHSAL